MIYFKVKRVKLVATIGVVALVLSGCASTEGVNTESLNTNGMNTKEVNTESLNTNGMTQVVSDQIQKGSSVMLGSIAAGLLGSVVPGGAAVGVITGALTGAAVQYSIDYVMEEQADAIAKLLGTEVSKDPKAALDANKNLIITDNERYIKILVRDSVMFSSSSSRLTSRASKRIDEVGKILQEHPNTIIQVAGFTDNIGSDKHNHRLSKRRAKSVIDRLYHAGVDNPSYATGCASANPLVPNDSKKNMALNRRIEIYLYPDTDARIDPCLSKDAK